MFKRLKRQIICTLRRCSFIVTTVPLALDNQPLFYLLNSFHSDLQDQTHMKND